MKILGSDSNLLSGSLAFTLSVNSKRLGVENEVGEKRRINLVQNE